MGPGIPDHLGLGKRDPSRLYSKGGDEMDEKKDQRHWVTTVSLVLITLWFVVEALRLLHEL